MARIAGVDLPKDKRIEIALTYVYGIGRTTATKILEETGKMTCEEVGKLAGFDLETKDFWMKEISTFKSDIDFLREYSNGRG